MTNPDWWFDAIHAVEDRLRGSYNEKGVRQWWTRERAELDGRTPMEVFLEADEPHHESIERVFKLAQIP